jgi:hypothetical protein
MLAVYSLSGPRVIHVVHELVELLRPLTHLLHSFNCYDWPHVKLQLSRDILMRASAQRNGLQALLELVAAY